MLFRSIEEAPYGRSIVVILSGLLILLGGLGVLAFGGALLAVGASVSWETLVDDLVTAALGRLPTDADAVALLTTAKEALAGLTSAFASFLIVLGVVQVLTALLVLAHRKAGRVLAFLFGLAGLFGFGGIAALVWGLGPIAQIGRAHV